MPFDFKLPDLGEGIHEAEILAVKIIEGQTIAEDAPLFEVETDKAVVEIPSPVAGQVSKIYIKSGDTISVGSIMVSIVTDSPKDALPPSPTDKSQPSIDKDPVGVTIGKNNAIASTAEVIATPATRQLARELKVDIHFIKGTGNGGKVLKEDVLAFANNKSTTSAKVSEPESSSSEKIEILPDFQKFGDIERLPMRSIRKRTAKLMSISWAKIPHVTHCDEANITELEKLKQIHSQILQQKGVRLTLTAFLVKAIGLALEKFPQFNASLDESKEEIIIKRYYNIGMATATDRGLIVPVIKNVDQKNITQLAIEINNLVEKTRNGKVELDDLQGGTFTITNIGVIGGTSATPIIHYPEVAILATMQAKEKPIVRSGKIETGLILPMSLAFDHRVTDGAEAASFLSFIIRTLEEPSVLSAKL